MFFPKTCTKALQSLTLDCNHLGLQGVLMRCISHLQPENSTVELHSCASDLKSAVLPYEGIPRTSKYSWQNFYTSWKTFGFQNLHHAMVQMFDQYGPIYREKIGKQEVVNIMLPEDIATVYAADGLYPRRPLLEPWSLHREYRNQACGIFLKNGEQWRKDRLILNKDIISPEAIKRCIPLQNSLAADITNHLQQQIQRKLQRSLTIDVASLLHRYTLESICNILYGERLGLLDDNPSEELLKFLSSMEVMLKTTVPLLYLPVNIAKALNARIWKDHVAAWDYIHDHAESYIEKIYHSSLSGQQADTSYKGILAELLFKADLPKDHIKANIIELMAGGSETSALPILFTLFELARNPKIQAEIRDEITVACRKAHGDTALILSSVPLLRGAIKESLRLYPIGIVQQRFTNKDIVLQNYHIPASTLVQIGLYPMGRSAKVFPNPKIYDPKRWLKRDNSFKSMAFGFGPRQCIGRRIAELEMLLFFIHILQNFKIDAPSKEDIKTVYKFVLVPEKNPLLTFKPIY
uniref:steroid 11beta-monooxygenase n=1 Tax=Protopterus annectens TaxID=7888 RepID=A0A2U9NKL4_PROAN|nr:CYP11B [Protopterus annectens]